MGQYYLILSLDRRQQMSTFAGMFQGNRIIFSRSFSSGCKLAEQYYNLGRKPFLALALLAYPPVEQLPAPWGSWASDRIVIIGDYSDDQPDFLTSAEQEELISEKQNLYHWGTDKFQKVTATTENWIEPLEQLSQIIPAGTEYAFMNLDTRQYLDPAAFDSSRCLGEFVMERAGIMQALLSTLFWSTGGGGGDIDELRQGRWAGQRLQLNRLSTAQEEGFKDISQEVKELVDAVNKQDG